jgi:hypothetical protein
VRPRPLPYAQCEHQMPRRGRGQRSRCPHRVRTYVQRERQSPRRRQGQCCSRAC